MSTEANRTRLDRGGDRLGTVVDADFHLTEQEEDFLPYIPDPFNTQLSQASDHHTHGLYPTPGFYNNITRGYNEQRSVTTRSEVQAGMKRFGQDRVVITPTRNLYLGCVNHDDLAVALATAYNDWLLDRIVDVESGIYGAAIVAPQKPDRAAEEIDRIANEDGIVSVLFPNGGVDPMMGHRVYHPIYDAATDHGLPIAMHIASGSMPWAFPNTYKSFNRMLPNHFVSHPFMQMSHLADMVTRGIFVRYPDLRFVVQEAGLGWIPFFLERFDHEYRNNSEDAPMLERLPSEYVKDRCFFTSQPAEGTNNPTYFNTIVRLFDGAENLMFSTDYPHFDFDNADVLLESLGQFDDDELRAIYGETALDVYRFPA